MSNERYRPINLNLTPYSELLDLYQIDTMDQN